MSSETWIATLGRAEAASGNGQWLKAAYIARTCIEANPDDPDAVSWATFSLYRYHLALNQPDHAVELVSSILRQGVNMAAKLNAASTALDYYARTTDPDKANDLISQLDACIEMWLSSGKFLEDDIAITAGANVISQASHYDAAKNSKHLHLATIEAEHDVVADLTSTRLGSPDIEMYNVLPHHVATIGSQAGPKGTLSLRTAARLSMRRCGNCVCVFNEHGRLLPIIYTRIPAFFRHVLETMAARSEPREIGGVTISLLDEFNNGLNFCHWTLDYLPRLLFAKQVGASFDNIVGPVPLTPGFHRDSLATTLPGRSYMNLENGVLYKFERLIYCDNYQSNLRHPAYDCHPDLISLLRKELAPTGTPNAFKKIYVPRRHSRRVANDQELWAVLAKLGFVRLDTDAMPLGEQIAAFENASHVVAPHGAALTNLLFCRPGTHVLELFPKFGGSASYYALAAGTDLNYSCFIDVPHGEAPVASLEPYVNTADMRVDLDFVRKWFSMTMEAAPKIRTAS